MEIMPEWIHLQPNLWKNYLKMWAQAMKLSFVERDYLVSYFISKSAFKAFSVQEVVNQFFMLYLGDKPCLGYRSSPGGPYAWLTYNEVRNSQDLTVNSPLYLLHISL